MGGGFQEVCLLFFALFYYSLLFLKFERGRGYNPRNPPIDPPMNGMHLLHYAFLGLYDI